MPTIPAPARFTFRNGDVEVHEIGEGSTVGYLHGVFGNPAVHPILEELGRTHRVVAPTLPGFNGSTGYESLDTIYDWVVAVSEVIDLAGLAGRPLVASSLGAMLALELAAVRPEAFSSLVLVAPLGLWNDADPVADLFGRPFTEEQAFLTSEPNAAQLFYTSDPALPTEDVVAAELRRHITRRTVASLLWGIPDHGLRSRLHRVKAPVTLIWGTEDALIGPAYMEAFRARLPNVVGCHLLEGAGHQADWDRPGQVASIAADAIREPLPLP
jgi:pimeloyl-ACP methyl ester carboxylesterase